MTGASGTPTASSPAMKGITSHEQKGARPPTKAARTIMEACLPTKARATRFSAPVALSRAIRNTAIAIIGAVPYSALKAEDMMLPTCSGSSARTSSGMSTTSVQGVYSHLRTSARLAIPRNTTSVICFSCLRCGLPMPGV